MWLGLCSWVDSERHCGCSVVAQFLSRLVFAAVNIPAPKLEEGELAGNCRSAPQKDQQPGKDVTRDLTASYERRSRERYSSERMSREQSPSRLRHDWLERSRSRSRDAGAHTRCSRQLARLSHK